MIGRLRRSHRDRRRRRDRGRGRARRGAAGGRRRRRRRGARRGRRGSRTADASALLLVVGAADGAPVLPSVPLGARRLASCVRIDRTPRSTGCSRDCSPRSCSSTAGGRRRSTSRSRRRASIAVTREGDRFGGPTPWRAGPPGVVGVTPAALAEALERRRRRRRRERPPPPTLVEVERQQLAAARRAELLAAERERQTPARARVGSRVAPPSCAARSTCEAASLDERHALLTRRLEQLVETEALDPADRAIAAAARLAAAVAALDEARAAECDRARRARRYPRRGRRAARADAARLRQELEVRERGDRRAAVGARGPARRGRGPARRPVPTRKPAPAPGAHSSRTSATPSTRSRHGSSSGPRRAEHAGRPVAPPPPGAVGSGPRRRAQARRAAHRARRGRTAARRAARAGRPARDRRGRDPPPARAGDRERAARVRLRARRRDRGAAARGPRRHDALGARPRARARAAPHGPDQPARAVASTKRWWSGTSSCSNSSTTCATRGASWRA